MTTIPEIIPISEMRQRQNEILQQISNGPVVLTQHGKAAAVLVDPAQWNRFMEELDDLRDVLTLYEQAQAVAAGQLELEDIDMDELREWIDGGKMAP